MTLFLHDHGLSPYAQKVRLMLREKGIPFEAKIPAGLGSGSCKGYETLTPRVEVPALVIGDRTIFESTIILEYLEEAYPDPPMLPSAPLLRARSRMIEDVFDTHWEAINWGLIELRYFGRGGDRLGPTLRASAEKELGLLYRWLEGELGDAAWLSGERFGWADIAALPFVATSTLLGIAPPAGSRVEAWLARGQARPSVAATVAEGEALLPMLETLLPALESGAFRRHYRDHRLEWMIRSGGIQVVLDGMAANNVRFTDLGHFAKSG